MPTILENYIIVFTTFLGMNIILSLIVIFLERKNPTSTLLWVMSITFLPILGFILYLLIGMDFSRNRLFTRKSEEDRKAEEALYDDVEPFKADFTNSKISKYEGMVKYFANTAYSNLTGHNEVELIVDGNDLFDKLLDDINDAKQSIYIESYIIKPGKLYDRLFSVLKEKAQSGLDVRILVDGMGGKKLKKKHYREMEEAGIKIAVFFPPLLRKLHVRINYRNHRKIYLIDSKIGYVGGFNIGDEYIGLSKKFGYWRDTHLRMTGDAVMELQSRFYFDYVFVTNDNSGRYQTSIEDHSDKSSYANIVACGPDHYWEQIRDGYSKMIELSEERIYLQTPYFIPDEGLFKSLRMAGFSGVDVRIMIPEKPDHPFVHWASLSYIGELLEAGVRVFKYKREGFLHSKTLLSDDYVSTIGTANFDIRSFKLNFEVNAFVYDEKLNRELAQSFFEDQENCHELTLEEYNNRSRLTKIRESISRLLSPLL